MRNHNLAATLTAMLLGASGIAHGAEVLKTDRATMDVGGRLQVLGFGQSLEDGSQSNQRFYLFLKQGRLSVSGNVDDWRYKVQLAFGGEDEVKATSGISLGLLDMYVDVPIPVLGKSYVRVGQFKVPYSRERLMDSGSLLFADRSVQNQAFRMGRDVGATFFTQAGPVVGGLGIFTGGGRDIPERYLPQTLGSPMVVLRVGYDGGLGEDVFATPTAPVTPPDKAQVAFFVNGLYVKDSRVGHSTVFNVRAAERSLLTNTNWNPYLSQSPFDLGRLWQIGADAAFRAPAGPGVVSAEVEGNFGVYQNTYGDLRVPGGRAQVAYNWKPVDVALRYSFILPDQNFAVGDAQITGTGAIQELTPALTYSFPHFPAKIVADLPIQLGTPVIFEDTVGSYLLTEQPDQTALLKKSAPITRQTVVEARLMVQASF
ncbi:porin [Archangium sp.]|uniref:porin n=1 Tax=Archangium sp. TaxID=1872627 RepID=UPI00389B297F